LEGLSSATIGITVFGVISLTVPLALFLPNSSPEVTPDVSGKAIPSKVSWISASDGQTPAGSLKGGEERDGTPLFVCRAKYRNGLHPGKLIGKNCNITYGGTQIVVSSYEVLTNVKNPDWQFASNGQIFEGTVQGGQELDRRLFICRVPFNGGLHPGKVIARNCNIPFEGTEIVASDYELLVSASNTIAPSENK